MNIYPLHILLADDDEDDRGFFQDVLKELMLNVQFTMVEDGEELMQWLMQKKDMLPDLLFMDLNMPRKNGHQCLKEIKQHPVLKSLPVIIISTAANPIEINILYQDGAHYYIQKPNSFETLVQVIERVLRLFPPTVL